MFAEKYYTSLIFRKRRDAPYFFFFDIGCTETSRVSHPSSPPPPQTPPLFLFCCPLPLWSGTSSWTWCDSSASFPFSVLACATCFFNTPFNFSPAKRFTGVPPSLEIPLSWSLFSSPELAIRNWCLTYAFQCISPLTHLFKKCMPTYQLWSLVMNPPFPLRWLPPH